MLGSVASTAFKHSFKQVQKREWDTVVDDPLPLERHVRAVFAGGAGIVLDIMNRNICREFHLNFSEGHSLSDYVKEALSQK